MTNVEKYLSDVVKNKGAGYIVLIDPDRQTPEEAGKTAREAELCGADVILVGSSIILNDTFDQTILAIKKACKIPVIIFPGTSSHVSKHADALFFMSLISGRNPEYLIGEQVKAAPIVMKHNMESIPLAYILISGGKTTAVEFMSNTKPIPSDKPDIIVAHALAAQYLGFKFIYLEAGSGATESISAGTIAAVKRHVNLPLIVGGGIRSPEAAREKIKAGASFVVTGTIVEEDHSTMKRISRAVHK